LGGGSAAGALTSELLECVEKAMLARMTCLDIYRAQVILLGARQTHGIFAIMLGRL
jgi:hypothetical protein